MVVGRLLRAARAVLDAPFAQPRSRETLFSFASPAALDAFYAYSDEQDGGRSAAVWRHEARDGGIGVFCGHLDTGFDAALEADARATPASFAGARMVRSGYASVRSMEPAPFGELDEFDGVALVVRSDSRPYVVNIKTARFMQDTQEVFQALVPPPPPSPPAQDAPHATAAAARPRRLQPGEMGAWREVRIPWDAFRLTWRGFVQPQDIKLDPRRIESVGIALYAADPAHADIGYAAMREGPFTLELRAIEAYADIPGSSADRGMRVTQSILRAPAG
ncbi:hypothetical protein KFE25_002546 [Diacronema lutheri]|uniref:NADH:ubiquinone oxidoreductase intermediate-associated protein 30 domain-containing protein n=1 Tax=Diacronema lutheri TaxID=2081491 RepID=A0A8J5XEC1_DIALT|nr:hypothetical protein KFE25_002546 [Diacronema lutheri]